MACAHLDSKPSYTYADLVYESMRVGLKFDNDEVDCLDVHCQDCPFADENSVLYGNNCSQSLEAALTYHRAGLIDILELLI